MARITITGLPPAMLNSSSARPATPVHHIVVRTPLTEQILAVGLTTQCGYCLEIHRKAAEEAGATQQEIAETIMIAGALRAGAALTHGTQILSD